ncbi:MAG TPA: glycoside hydrolase family 3 N-terminal domain-containing protein [Candidatus Acidoferrales bacterium]|nr:glycoside hydrolase family 3 N-terminal domain-containing protein [Candidatus Acidoferrales bacterium]
MPARHALILLIFLLAALPAATHTDEAPAIKPLSPAQRQWVDETLAQMSMDEKVGQVVFPTYFGAFESVESAGFKELMTQVKEDHIGGFILATRRGPRGIELSHVYETAVLTNELQNAAKLPLLIGADFEHGTVMRVEEGTSFPHAMAVSATGRPEDAYAMGRVTAIEARAMGVHWVFAPVADVNSNPDNPVINIRSFGEDPKRVAEYVAQFVRGVEENGAMATAKHFPGHGDTSIDSHLDLPLVTASRERLNDVEFVPFEVAIGAGAEAVMTAHLAVPALEPNPDTPATLSERVLTGVLRDELHFQGLVITDALDMGGVTKGFPPGEVAVRALLAGADVLLMSPVTDAALASVRDSVSSGRVPMTRLDEAVRHVLEAKARLGLDKQREVDIEKLGEVFGRPEFQATAADIAARGVALLRNDAGLVPLDPRTTKRVLLLAVSADPDTVPAEPFERELRAQLDAVESVHVDTKYFRVEETHLPPPESYDLAICAVTVRTADRKGTIGLPANEAEMIHALLRAGKPVIMVGLGSPYLMESFPEAGTWLAAFSTADVAQRAAAQALLGTFAVSGKLPVSLPGAAPHALRVGDGMTTAAIPMALHPASAEMESRFERVFALVGNPNGEPTSGVLRIGYRGEEVVHLLSERRPALQLGSNVPSALRPDLERIYRDGPIRTTLIARLVQTKQLSLDTPLATVLQGTRLVPATGWKDVTLRRLLEGTSGLELVHRAGGDKGEVQDVLSFSDGEGSRDAREEAEREIEAIIVTTLTGMKYVPAAEKLLFEPLSFSCAGVMVDCEGSALALVGQLWLNGGIYAHRRLLSRQTVEQFTAPKREQGRAFTAGWKISEVPGHSFSSRSYGWADPPSESLWMDPEHELFVVLLVPGPHNWSEMNPTGFSPPPESRRARAYDAIFAALGLETAK